MQGSNLHFVLGVKALFAFTERKKTKPNEQNSAMISPNLVILNAFC